MRVLLLMLLMVTGTLAAVPELPRNAAVSYQAASEESVAVHGSLGGDLYHADQRFALCLGKQGWNRSEHLSFRSKRRPGLLSIWTQAGGRTLYLFIARSKTKTGAVDFILGNQPLEQRK